ncbi:MAG: hypothetical protein IRZ04_07625 [Rhodospirillales bacterium]|nr:hypothetical protein [Rhodospirillales bacterium]
MSLQELGQAIARHPVKVAVAFCGFDLWLAVFASGKVETRRLKKGGVPADGSEPEGTITAPVPVIGGDIVVAFDPTLPPNGFRLAP